MIFIKKPDARKASPLRYLVFIFNLFRLPARSDILHFLRCHRFAPGVSATAHPSRRAVLCRLVMEQSDSGKYAALMCAFDVIGERAACVRAQGYIGQPV